MSNTCRVSCCVYRCALKSLAFIFRTFLFLVLFNTTLIPFTNKAAACPPDPKGDAVFDKNLPRGSQIVLDSSLFKVTGNPLSYEWYGPFSRIAEPSPSVFIPEGTYAVTLFTNNGLQRSDPHTLYFSVDPEYFFLPVGLKGKVVMAWLPVQGAQGYDIYRAPETDPSNFIKIAELGPSAFTYTDPNLKDATYLYVVGVLLNGTLSFSHVASAHPFLTIPKLNYPPVIYSQPVTPAIVGLPYIYDVLATDPQLDIMTYSLINPPSGMTINPLTGCIQWTPPAIGDYEITVKVKDWKGASVLQTFIIEADELPPLNLPPVARAGGPYTGGVNQTITFNGSGSTDPNGYPLTYNWNFGDGSFGSGVAPVHKYTSPGIYAVKLTVSNNNGGISSDATKATIQCSPPTVSITADPTAIKPGDPCALIWTSENAQSVSIDNGIGAVAASGTISVNPQSTTTYTITATGACGTQTQSVTVTVYQPPTVSIKATPNSIITGQTSILSWSSTNAVTATIDNNIGAVPANSSLTVKPTTTTTYTIYATGPGGMVTASVTVTVLQPPHVTITSQPQTITEGDSSTLTWISDNADTAALDNGIGQVDVNGSLSVSPSDTGTYTITAQGPGGTATASATITVIHKPTVAIAASPTTINAGDTTTLTWTTTNADSATIDQGIGDVDVNDFLEVDLDNTMTFTITATGPGGTATASVTVEVLAPPAQRNAYAYFTNRNSNDVSVVDLTMNTVISHIEVGYGPYCVAVSPDGDTAYVTSREKGISIIDAATNTLTGNIPVFVDTIAVSPDGKSLYGVSRDEGTLESIDIAFGTILKSVEVGPSPHGIAVNNEGTRIYVSSLDDGMVRVIDALSMGIIATVAVTEPGDPVWDVEVNPCGSTVYAVSAGSCKLTVIDGKTNAVIGSHSYLPKLVVSQCYLAVSPDGQRIALSDLAPLLPRTIYLIDSQSLDVLSQFYAQRPSDLTFTADGSFVYCPDASINGVFIVDTWDQWIVGTIQGDFSDPSTYGHFIAEHKEEISGRVVSNGSGVEGVVVSLSNENINICFSSDSQGQYFSYAPPGQYTLSVTGNGNVLSTQNQTVDVTDNGVSIPDIEVLLGVRMWAEPYAIINGGSFVLHWSSIKAVSVTIDHGIGTVSTSGSLAVSPAETTTYSITATDGQGSTVTDQVTITVFQQPTVSITADPMTITQGQSATLSWTSTNADAVSIDQSIGNVDLSGSMTVSPSQTTTFIITATGPGGANTASITINVSIPPITLTSPHNGDTISRPDIMVTGTIDIPLSGNKVVTVNGLPALIYGNTFVVNHVPLFEGVNTITIDASDDQGHSGEISQTVTANTSAPYITLTPDDSSGQSPLETTLHMNATFYMQMYATLSVSGPGQVECLSGITNQQYDYQMTGSGIYYFTASVVNSGQVYSDTIGVVVLNTEDTDALIRAKWNGMKSSLINSDIDGALKNFALPSQDEYQNIFNRLSSQLPAIASGMEDIEQVYVRGYVAKYRIKKDEVINGISYRITHYIYFVQDANGNWYVDSF